ncbi:hypothetical protein F3I62_19530 [Pseudomonas sp. R-28-1W-6]|uniref:hypothetical protein n=1 Tax=Pseudomonas sp. R-28-1W-6 TaxID=2650101 RepID=UPI001366327B|nr:hypothetical protein [Pseudomonas sp. R-28-1W-6]MWV14298.1 hypothetical protein [Pseudomonas sp. R-28-1W-6]
MIKPLLAASALLAAAATQAEPHSSCITNELDEHSVTAELAMVQGKCHLTYASANPDDVPSLEYAHSWFKKAQTLGSVEATKELKEVERKLQLTGHYNE